MIPCRPTILSISMKTCVAVINAWFIGDYGFQIQTYRLCCGEGSTWDRPKKLVDSIHVCERAQCSAASAASIIMLHDK